MDLATIEMEKDEAQTKFEEYREAVTKRHDDEDAVIMRGYKALARGHRLIHLSQTIAAGGIKLKSAREWRNANPRTYPLPNLAVAWADQTAVFAERIRDDGSFVYFWNPLRNPLATARNIRLGARTFDLSTVENMPDRWTHLSFTAMVPKVPPALRPARSLRGYHILWEADWRQHTPPAPKDPALLKRIGGDLYAVIAVWDLTELERAVLSGRTA